MLVEYHADISTYYLESGGGNVVAVNVSGSFIDFAVFEGIAPIMIGDADGHILINNEDVSVLIVETDGYHLILATYDDYRDLIFLATEFLR